MHSIFKNEERRMRNEEFLRSILHSAFTIPQPEVACE
jgi:hypothetical protein